MAGVELLSIGEVEEIEVLVHGNGGSLQLLKGGVTLLYRNFLRWERNLNNGYVGTVLASANNPYITASSSLYAKKINYSLCCTTSVCISGGCERLQDAFSEDFLQSAIKES